MLKFLVDESSGKKLAAALAHEGFDVVYVGDALKECSDSEVLKAAEDESRILITNDKDFGELVFRRLKPHGGVMLLRLQFDSPEARIKQSLGVIRKLGSRLENSFTVVSEESVRLRKGF